MELEAGPHRTARCAPPGGAAVAVPRSNGIKVLAGPGPEVGLTPNQVVWRRGKAGMRSS